MSAKLTDPVGSLESDEERRIRLSHELTIAFKEALKQEGLPSPLSAEVLAKVFSRLLTTLHPDANDYTPGLDRMVAAVEGLKRSGWVLMPNRGRSSTLLFKGYENLQLFCRVLDTGRIDVDFQAVVDIPSLNLKANESKNMGFPDLDTMLIACLKVVHGGFEAAVEDKEVPVVKN